ncbi:hypothetical protein LCGC14_2138180 [marine sediment metagenome]|uniref:Uncharacterized protein n=1 Tax=marine sediment metagenome TaxID=412755 RepID=A0A0F9GVF9_9ZZZZ
MKTETKKKFRLDLSEYTVEVDEPVIGEDKKLVMENGRPKTEKKIIDYPIRDNLSDFLRTAGIYKSAEEIAEAVGLARQIREADKDCLILDEKEASVLRTVLDILIERTADGRANIGGIIHEEMICRVVNMEVVEE